MALTLIAIVLAGCSNDTTADGQKGPSDSSSTSSRSVPPANSAPSATSSQPSGPSDAAPTGSATLSQLRDITGYRTVALDKKTLPAPPPGFTSAEVDAFADRAIDIVSRGVSPDLAGRTPAEAFRFVFANQYPETTDQASTSTEAASGRYDWEWAWASLFNTRPRSPAAFLGVRWQVDTTPGELSDGTAAAQLVVSLDATILHLVPDTSTPEPDKATEPIVVERTVIVKGFKPLGGREWWPGIGVQTDLLLGGKCAPANGSVLTVAHDPAVIRADLRKLRRHLERPDDIQTDSESSATSLQDFVERYCEE